MSIRSQLGLGTSPGDAAPAPPAPPAPPEAPAPPDPVALALDQAAAAIQLTAQALESAFLALDAALRLYDAHGPSTAVSGLLEERADLVRRLEAVTAELAELKSAPRPPATGSACSHDDAVLTSTSQGDFWVCPCGENILDG